MNWSLHVNHRLLFGVVLSGFIFLTVIIGIGPALWVQNHNSPLPGSRALTEQESRGLTVYIAEGCLYCHTQQVRPLAQDKPFGRPSAPGDYARLAPLDIWRMTPALLGTERTGPDLINVANRQPSDTWNYIHLYNPRTVVKDSVMQAYPWLFEVKSNPSPGDVIVPVPPAYAPKKGKVVATQKARDLVAYLLSLKQVVISVGETAGEQKAAPGVNQTESAQGAAIYASLCASCHQPNGEGLPGTFPALKGDPVVNDRDAMRHVETVLFGLQGLAINGAKYAAPMPSFADKLSDTEVAAVVNHERTSWGNHAPMVSSEDVTKIRKQKKQKD